jgi:hypothetical protein
MYSATRHANYSAALSTEATATFMFLPSWNKRMTTNPYASLCRKYPHMCKFLGTIPSDQLQYAKVPQCLQQNWRKELAKEIPEAKWEISYIHNDPYPSELRTEKTPGLIKVRNLPKLGSPTITFVKPSHKAPNIKQVPWTHLKALTKQPNAAPAQTWSVSTSLAGLDLHWWQS